MKTTISKLKYVFFLLVIAGLFSCKGEIGPPGADGLNGADGTDGIDGADGADGNANVQTYIYPHPSWGSASGMHIPMIGILTLDVIENDAILTYVKHTDHGYVNQIPGLVWNGNYREYAVFHIIDDLDIVSLETDGSFTPNANLWDIDWVKVVIIESTNTKAGSSMNPQQAIYDELENAGVDISNYNEVMDYYGLDY